LGRRGRAASTTTNGCIQVENRLANFLIAGNSGPRLNDLAQSLGEIGIQATLCTTASGLMEETRTKVALIRLMLCEAAQHASFRAGPKMVSFMLPWLFWGDANKAAC